MNKTSGGWTGQRIEGWAVGLAQDIRRLAILSDVRFAFKSLCRTPAFTLIAVITLGLGIGANTSMFSILNGYMLRPAPYPDRDHLYRIFRSTPQDSRGGFSPADYLDLKSEMNGYGEIATYGSSEMSLSEPGKPAQTAEGLRVSANLFSILGTRPQLGRSFRRDEEILGNHHLLILSHRYWQDHFGGDGQVIGRTVRVDGEPHEIVGDANGAADDLAVRSEEHTSELQSRLHLAC